MTIQAVIAIIESTKKTNYEQDIDISVQAHYCTTITLIVHLG
jgi:hypothetical protein